MIFNFSFAKIKYLYRAWKYRYLNDRAELSYLTQNVHYGDSVLDIGAHKGGYLYWLSKSVGKTGEVIAFEPQPLLYEYLKTTINHLHYKNISLHHAGVSSKPNKLKLFVPKAPGLTSPGATFEYRSNKTQGHAIEVDVVQLDDFLSERKSKIDFIKVDVEGHEMEVFKGASNILEQDHPTLLFECENRHLNDLQVEDVFAFLKSKNYEGYFFDQDQMRPIDEFDAREHQQISDSGQIIDKKKYVNNFVFHSIS